MWEEATGDSRTQLSYKQEHTVDVKDEAVLSAEFYLRTATRIVLYRVSSLPFSIPLNPQSLFCVLQQVNSVRAVDGGEVFEEDSSEFQNGEGVAVGGCVGGFDGDL